MIHIEECAEPGHDHTVMPEQEIFNM